MALDPLSLAGRVAVVTGAARGIGLAVAAELARAGAGVVLADVDGPAAAEAARTVGEETGARAVPFEADVAAAGSAAALAACAEDELGSLDIWVSNAGIYPATPLLELDDDEWRRVLAVNLDAAFAGAKEAARRMVAAGRGGVIVNISSTAAYRVAGPGFVHYTVAKHGLDGLTKSLAVELGPHGIRVLGVAPTVVATPGLERLKAESAAAAADVEALAARLPLGRVARPEDVAHVVLFCVSDLAGLMTGSTLLVDAGEMAL